MLLCLKQRKKVCLRTHSHVRQSHKITQADQICPWVSWWRMHDEIRAENVNACVTKVTPAKVTLSREKTTHKEQFAIIRNYISFKKKKIMSFDFSKWWKNKQQELQSLTESGALDVRSDWCDWSHFHHQRGACRCLSMPPRTMEHTSVSLTPARLTAGVTSLHFPRPVHTTHYQKGLLGSTCHMGRCGAGSLEVILDWDRPPASQGVTPPTPPITSYFLQHQNRLHHHPAAVVEQSSAAKFHVTWWEHLANIKCSSSFRFTSQSVKS